MAALAHSSTGFPTTSTIALLVGKPVGDTQTIHFVSKMALHQLYTVRLSCARVSFKGEGGHLPPWKALAPPLGVMFTMIDFCIKTTFTH